MDLKNYFQAFFEKVYKKKARVPMALEIRTMIHWKIMVITFLSAVVLVFVVNFLIYQSAIQKEFLPAGQGTASTSASASARLINTTVNFFQTKNATFDELRKTPAVSVDPSL